MKTCRRCRVFLAALLLLSADLPARAAGADEARPLTVEQAVEMGLSYSKVLKASAEKVEGAEARARENDSLRFPTMKFSGAYARLSKVPPFEIDLAFLGLGRFTINPTLLNAYNAQLTVQQPLFTGFQLSGLSELGRFEARAVREELRRDESEVALSVRTAYWTVYKAKDLKRLVDENAALVEAHLKDVRNLFGQGLASQNDVLKVQVQLSSVQVMQLQAANGVILATMALDSLIGLPVDTEIRILSSVREPAPDAPPLDSLLSRALDRRPEVKTLDLQIKAAGRGSRSPIPAGIPRSSWSATSICPGPIKGSCRSRTSSGTPGT